MLKDGLMFKTPNTAMAGIIETPPRHTHGTDRHGRVMAGASCRVHKLHLPYYE
jgi:hypothetical protein